MTREIRNIGTVIINYPIIKGNKIALIMPVETMSDKLQVIVDELVHIAQDNANTDQFVLSTDIELWFSMECKPNADNPSSSINIFVNYEDEFNFYKKYYEEIEVSLSNEDRAFLKVSMVNSLVDLLL